MESFRVIDNQARNMGRAIVRSEGPKLPVEAQFDNQEKADKSPASLHPEHPGCAGY